MTNRKSAGIVGVQAIVFCALLLAGCAQTDQGTAPAVATETAQETEVDQTKSLEQREQEIAERERELARREAVVEERAPRPVEPVAKPTVRRPPVEATPVKSAPPVQLVNLTVPTMTGFQVELLDRLSSETNVVGDRFRARLVRDIVVADKVALPAGSWVSGSVTDVQSTKKIGGQARLTLDFDRIELASGDSAPLHATLAEAGKKQTKKDAATIGGAAAGGALLGRILGKDKDKGTLVGAALGAAVGTAVAAKNQGDPVEIEIGTIADLMTDEPVTIVLEGDNRRFDDYATNR